MKILKVAVGSKNPVKIEAVKEAFQKVWTGKTFEFIGTEVLSGVPDQPMSDEESIKGATIRANNAIKSLLADFGVGLEGGLQKIGERWFDCGWIVVIDREGRTGFGSSLRMEAPKKMMELIHQGIELGKVNDLLFKTENSKHDQGHFGLMTDNVISRKEGYRDGIIAALAAFMHPELFEE